MTSSPHDAGSGSGSDDEDTPSQHADSSPPADLGEEDAVGEDAMQEDDAPQDS